MIDEKYAAQRDILLLYISDQFKELFAIDRSGKADGIPLESEFVDRLLMGLVAAKPSADVHKQLFDRLSIVWRGRMSDMEIHKLINQHTGRMKTLVGDAKMISRQAQAKCDADTENMLEIKIIAEKRDIIRRYAAVQ